MVVGIVAVCWLLCVVSLLVLLGLVVVVIAFAVRCSLYVGCCVLRAVCSALSAAWCVFRVVCCCCLCVV